MKLLSAFVVMAAVSASASASAQEWNQAGVADNALNNAKASTAPAPKRDISGVWDAGGTGIGGTGYVSPPWTDWAKQKASTFKPGNGPRAVFEADINDPLSTVCDPTGFPREVLYETRPFQVVQTPNQVLILYMFEKRWRVIWTDGRPLPKDPDPRWYGYSVGHWEDDTTFVVNTVGTDERSWLDNSGNPHSDQLKVEERYHRVNHDLMELTVTLDDPKAYTQPWTPRNKMPLALAPPDFDMLEMICSPTEVMEFRKQIYDRTTNK